MQAWPLLSILASAVKARAHLYYTTPNDLYGDSEVIFILRRFARWWHTNLGDKGCIGRGNSKIDLFCKRQWPVHSAREVFLKRRGTVGGGLSHVCRHAPWFWVPYLSGRL